MPKGTIVLELVRYSTEKILTLISKFPDIDNGEMCDVIEKGILESYNVKLCMISSATEAAEQVHFSCLNSKIKFFQILRVDEIIKCAPRPRAQDRRPC